MTARDRLKSRKPEPPQRPLSQLRVRAQGSGARISTLPPPPFEREIDVAGLEWWLEAHMSLAGSLLCVEQILEPASDNFERALAASLERIRDALYELYCDAADPRLHNVATTGGALAEQLRPIYRACEELAALTLDRDAAVARERVAGLEGASVTDDWLSALAIDEATPLEPLRRLRRDLAALRSALDLCVRILRLTP